MIINVPERNSDMGAVSCLPVRRRLLCSPYTSICSLCFLANFSMCVYISCNPPSALVAFVLQLVWHPAPFQSPITHHQYTIKMNWNINIWLLTLNWLRMERNNNAKTFSNPLHDVARNPQMISHINSQAWTHLIFPLSWHHLCINSGNLYSREKTSSKLYVSIRILADSLMKNNTYSEPQQHFFQKLYQHQFHSSKDPEEQEIHSWATQAVFYQEKIVCTLAQFQTKAHGL